MRKRIIDLIQDCLAVLESADIEDTDALIGQLRAEVALYKAKADVRSAFENAEAPVSKPKSAIKRKPVSNPKHKGTNAKSPAISTLVPLVTS